MRKELGKISHVQFGSDADYPFLFGLQLTFTGSGWGCRSGAMYMINMERNCKWDHEAERNKAITDNLEAIREIMKKAKVEDISCLKGIPVEVTFNDGDCFHSFRVLEEVL